MDGNSDMAPDLGLELELGELALTGRKSVPLRWNVLRPLRASDLALLASGAGRAPVHLKKVRDRHHGLARLLAGGVCESEAAAIMGYTPSRVSVLKQDPAFSELLELYRDKADGVFSNVLDQTAGLALDVVTEIRDRLEEDPESFKAEDLRRLLETTMDRTGHGPSSKVEHHHTHDLAAKINAARERALHARKIEAGVIVDAEVVEESPKGA